MTNHQTIISLRRRPWRPRRKGKAARSKDISDKILYSLYHVFVARFSAVFVSISWKVMKKWKTRKRIFFAALRFSLLTRNDNLTNFDFWEVVVSVLAFYPGNLNSNPVDIQIIVLIKTKREMEATINPFFFKILLLAMAVLRLMGSSEKNYKSSKPTCGQLLAFILLVLVLFG